MIKDVFNKKILIFGCGNTLMGDDGFGPAVIEYLNDNCILPEGTMAEDVGTSIGDLLFDLILFEDKPEAIFIVDAVSQPERNPGDLSEMTLEQIPVNKAGDFCMHQFPSVNYLSELQQSGTRVRVLTAQMKKVPDKVQPGLSPEIENAVPKACDWVLNEINTNNF